MSERRDIAADRKMCEAATKFNYTLGIWKNEVARAECYTALPHYLTRCEELEAALAAAIERLASVLCVYPLSLPRTCNGRCHDCWRSWLEQQGKEVPDDG